MKDLDDHHYVVVVGRVIKAMHRASVSCCWQACDPSCQFTMNYRYPVEPDNNMTGGRRSQLVCWDWFQEAGVIRSIQMAFVVQWIYSVHMGEWRYYEHGSWINDALDVWVWSIKLPCCYCLCQLKGCSVWPSVGLCSLHAGKPLCILMPSLWSHASMIASASSVRKGCIKTQQVCLIV